MAAPRRAAGSSGEDDMPKDGGIGASTVRREDIRFLTGKGRYTADINLRGQAYACFLRSEVAHGRINRIDTAEARAMPGVLAVMTGADFAAMGGNPAGWHIPSRNGEAMKEPKRPVLAHGKVRHVGDAYAVVVAETLEQARDAAGAVVADITELPAVVDMAQAVANPDLRVHDEIANNVCFDWGWIEDNRAAVDAAFKAAPHVTTLELVNNRLVPNAMEPRASIGDYDSGTGDYKLYTTSQNPHLSRLLIAAFVMGIPENKLTVIAPDVGGGFGSKIYHYGEEAAVLAASKALNRPVKWVADRSESFLSDAHGRDHVTRIELATDLEGNFLALRTETLANVGAYLSNFSTATPTFLHGTLMAGPYRTPLIYVNVKAVFTNTAPVDAYRGAGRPEATFSIERVVDKMCRELKLDPVAVRRKNLIQPDQYPYTTPVGLVYDTGNYPATLDKLIQIADFSGFEARRAESARRGKLRAQIVSDKLGIPASSIEIVHGDTSKIPFGMGSYGSRSLAVGGSAMVKAVDKIIAKGKKIAAHMLEAAEDDIVFEDGKFSVTGTDKAKTFGEIAFSAYVPHNYPLESLEPGLEETAFYDPANFTYPAGAYACEVEVDAETGRVEIVGFACADDFGNVMNPMIVNGQVHGGVAQGIGQALLEAAAYDDNGQLLTGSYMDYAMPRADDLPMFTVDHSCNTPCTHNPLGVKGCGEAGAIGSPPAVVNAVIDALHRGGHTHVTHIDMPLTPSRVWSAIQN